MTQRYMQSYMGSAGHAHNAARAKRSLGQNYLQDANIARKIVNCLHIAEQDSVLEIGPGPGALTVFIQERAPGRLVLVEKDNHWAFERMASASPRTCVVLADALTMPWERFVEPWKFIGNLPYNVASPLMWDICSRTPGLTRAVFMVQKEVALRLVARPSTSAYGALTVWIQSFMSAKLEFTVPPQVFRPRPKVDSAVVSFEPLTSDSLYAGGRSFCPEALAVALKACFQKRRKQLGGIVKSFGRDPAALEALGLDPRQRPEELSPADFKRLSAAGLFPAKGRAGRL